MKLFDTSETGKGYTFPGDIKEGSWEHIKFLESVIKVLMYLQRSKTIEFTEDFLRNNTNSNLPIWRMGRKPDGTYYCEID